jgi:single-stranded DNA-binding protein
MLVERDENAVRITGAVAREPEVYRTTTGVERAMLKVVTLSTWRSAGRPREEFIYHDVIAWDKVVRLVRDLKVGNRVTVLGHLKTFRWNHPTTGVQMSRTEIVADSVLVHHGVAA